MLIQIQLLKMPAATNGRTIRRRDSRRRSARYPPRLFQLAVHLNHHAVGGAGSVSDPADDVRDGDDRNRAVNREDISISQPEIAKANGEQDAWYRMGQKCDGVEEPAKTYLSPDDDPETSTARSMVPVGTANIRIAVLIKGIASTKSKIVS